MRRQRPAWAALELLLAMAIIAAGLQIRSIVFTLGSAPWLMGLGLVLVWWRGPGWREAGTYLAEPLIAQLTSGARPDVSQFQSLVGSKAQLAFWLTITWTLAAVVEELAYRGWILNRCAELGQFSRSAWGAGLLFSSLLFGVVHAYQGLSGMIATGLTGVVFGVTYLATGRNLWAAMIAHGTLDTVGFAMMYAGIYPGL